MEELTGAVVEAPQMNPPTETDLLAACQVFLPILKTAQENRELSVEIRTATVEAQVGLLKLDVELHRAALARMDNDDFRSYDNDEGDK